MVSSSATCTAYASSDPQVWLDEPLRGTIPDHLRVG